MACRRFTDFSRCFSYCVPGKRRNREGWALAPSILESGAPAVNKEGALFAAQSLTPFSAFLPLLHLFAESLGPTACWVLNFPPKLAVSRLMPRPPPPFFSPRAGENRLTGNEGKFFSCFGSAKDTTQQTQRNKKLLRRSQNPPRRFFKRPLQSIKNHPQRSKSIEQNRETVVACFPRHFNRIFTRGFPGRGAHFADSVSLRPSLALICSHGNAEGSLQKTQHKNGPASFARR